MRTTNLTSAISDLKASKYSKTSLAYKSALRLLEAPENGVVTGKEFGSGRYASSKEWSSETMEILRSLGIECKRDNIAARGGKWGERVFLTDNQRHMFEIVECLETMYTGKRNEWRLNNEIEAAKATLEKGEEYRIKRAQWGSKWGNWYRAICLKPKSAYLNTYQYVTGFNPFK